MRPLLVLAVLALAPLAAAQDDLETQPPCETGAPGCADVPTGRVGTGQEVPAPQDPTGGGQGGDVSENPPVTASYLPWVILSVVVVGALVAALGYTVRHAGPQGSGRRRI